MARAPEEAAAGSGGLRRSRRWLFRIHSWLGLNLGLLLFVICFSGTIAVFSPELAWLADPRYRVAPPPEGEREIAWEAMRQTIAREQPLARLAVIVAPHGPRWAATAQVAFAPGDYRTYLLDPYTGAMQGEAGPYNLPAFFRIFHKQLYVVPPRPWLPHGTVITGVFALVLLLSAVTGLLSYRRWWRGLLQLRTRRSLRLLVSDLHRLMGVWAFAVALVLAVTGGWYMVEKILEQAGAAPAESAGQAVPRALPARAGPLPLDLDQAAALARAAYPALEIVAVSPPRRPDDPIVFTGDAEAWLVRPRANQVHVDPASGAVTVRPATAMTLSARLVATADPLHFGTFGGLASRLVWLAAGLAICGGILTGLYGGWLLLRAEAAAPPRRRWAVVAATVLPTAALLALAVYATLAFNGALVRAADVSSRAAALGEVRLGPHRADVLRFGNAGYVVLFADGGRPEVRRASARIGDGTDAAPATPLRVFDDRLYGEVNAAAAACGDAACRLFLEAVFGDGTTVETSLPLPAHPPRHPQAPPPAHPAPAGVLAVIFAFVGLCSLPAVGWLALQLRPRRSTARPMR